MSFSQVKMDQTEMVEDLPLIMFRSQQVSLSQEDSLFNTYSEIVILGTKASLHMKALPVLQSSVPEMGLVLKGHTQQQNPSRSASLGARIKPIADKILCFNKSDSRSEADKQLLIMTQTVGQAARARLVSS